MLNAKPTGWFTNDYAVEDRGRLIATVPLNWSGASTFAVDGHEYTARREGFAGWLGDHVLQSEEETLLRVKTPNLFSRRFVITSEQAPDEPPLTLEAASAFSRKFHVEQEGLSLGEIRPVSVFSGKAEVDLADDVPLPIQLFLLWLVVTSWRQANQDAAGV